MGYYSDVAIQIEGSKEQLSKQMEVIETFACEPDEIKQNDEAILLLWNNIKWYEQSFDEIRAIVEWFDDLDAGKDIDSKQFIRIGEDYDDTEYINDGEINNYIGIERTFDLGEFNE